MRQINPLRASMINENRQAIRVNSHLVVSWRPLNNGQLITDDIQNIMTLSVNRELNALLEGLASPTSGLRDILLRLNHKIDLIAETHHARLLYGPALTRVNVSGTGIAFDWHDAIAAGQQIRLTITLPPSLEKVTLAAKVLDCTHQPSKDNHLVRCHFLAGQQEKIATMDGYIDHVHKHAMATRSKGDQATSRPTAEHSAGASLAHYR
jgi:hypothetical protein